MRFKIRRVSFCHMLDCEIQGFGWPCTSIINLLCLVQAHIRWGAECQSYDMTVRAAATHMPGSKPTLKAKLHWGRIPEKLKETGRRWDLVCMKKNSLKREWWMSSGRFWLTEHGDKMLSCAHCHVLLKTWFFPCLELRATSRAWPCFAASLGKVRVMQSRRFLQQLLPPQQTTWLWRLNSQRYCWKHSLSTFSCITPASLHYLGLI